MFNVHSWGLPLCAVGGGLTWAVYLLAMDATGSIFVANFWATAFAAAYSEIMARIRKYPAISYLVISIFTLIPGAGVYYTMNYAVRGEMELFAQKGMHTIAVAGMMAASMLLVSTTVRLHTDWKNKHHKKKPLG